MGQGFLVLAAVGFLGLGLPNGLLAEEDNPESDSQHLTSPSEESHVRRPHQANSLETDSIRPPMYEVDNVLDILEKIQESPK